MDLGGTKEALKRHAGLFLNCGMFVMVLCAARMLYSGRVFGEGDAPAWANPRLAGGFFEYAFNFYTTWEGRLVVIINWGIWQRIAAWFYPEQPLEFPWWIPIGITQFCLLASPLNFALFARRVLSASVSAGALIFLSGVAFWSLNPVFFRSSLNPGTGMYPTGVYLCSLLMLCMGRVRSRAQIVGGYIAFSLIVLHVDSVWGLGLALILFQNLVIDTPRLEWRSFLRALALAASIFIVGLLCTLLSPGLQARLKIIGKPVSTSVELFDRVGLFVTRTVENTFPRMFDSYILPSSCNYYLMYAILIFSIILICFAMMVYTYRNCRKNSNWDTFVQEKNWLPIFTLLALAGMHASFLRTFISLYHGAYANDNPTFSLFLVASSAILMIGTLVSVQKCNLPIINGVFFAIVLFCVLVPNLYGSIHQIRVCRGRGHAIRKAYNAVAGAPEAANSAAFFKLTGAPDSELALSVGSMLAWNSRHACGVTCAGTPFTVSLSRATPSGLAESPGAAAPKFISVDASTPQVNPWRRPFCANGVMLLRTQIHDGEVWRDYLLPRSTSHITLEVQLNPNVAGSSAYRSMYQYRLAFPTGWNGHVVHFPSVTLLSEDIAGVSPRISPTSISFLRNDVESDSLPIEDELIVRVKVTGGNSQYAYCSSEIEFR